MNEAQRTDLKRLIDKARRERLRRSTAIDRQVATPEGPVEAFVNLCEAHAELVQLDCENA